MPSKTVPAKQAKASTQLSIFPELSIEEKRTLEVIAQVSGLGVDQVIHRAIRHSLTWLKSEERPQGGLELVAEFGSGSGNEVLWRDKNNRYFLDTDYVSKHPLKIDLAFRWLTAREVKQESYFRPEYVETARLKEEILSRLERLK